MRLRLFFCTSIMIGNIFFVPAQTTITMEQRVEAAFLFNFTQFVTWPPTMFSSGTAPFVIGIAGRDPFGSYLDEIVAGEKVNGHPLLILRCKSIEEMEQSHILFLNLDNIKKTDEILSGLKGQPILTASDEPGFLEQGGMMRFFIGNNKVQIQVNLEAANAAGLTISSKLLRLVTIFTPFKNS
jgi:YfiR/HmsC-like